MRVAAGLFLLSVLASGCGGYELRTLSLHRQELAVSPIVDSPARPHASAAEVEAFATGQGRAPDEAAIRSALAALTEVERAVTPVAERAALAGALAAAREKAGAASRLDAAFYDAARWKVSRAEEHARRADAVSWRFTFSIDEGDAHVRGQAELRVRIATQDPYKEDGERELGELLLESTQFTRVHAPSEVEATEARAACDLVEETLGRRATQAVREARCVYRVFDTPAHLHYVDWKGSGIEITAGKGK